MEYLLVIVIVCVILQMQVKVSAYVKLKNNDKWKKIKIV